MSYSPTEQGCGMWIRIDRNNPHPSFLSLKNPDPGLNPDPEPSKQTLFHNKIFFTQIIAGRN
jgi:hypothetical protein